VTDGRRDGGRGARLSRLSQPSSPLSCRTLPLAKQRTDSVSIVFPKSTRQEKKCDTSFCSERGPAGTAGWGLSMVVVSYGALPGPSQAGPHGVRGHSRGVRAAAAVLGVLAAVAIIAFSAPADRKTELFFARFPRAPTSQLVSWDGCGAGGDCGGRYHWTAHSFSPVQGRQVNMQFTHDHNSIANWWNRTAFEMGLPGPHWVKGAHIPYDFSNGTYGYGGAYKGLTPSYNDPPKFNATWEPELIDPLEYWAQFFPIEKGYSSNLFGVAEEEEEEEAAEEEEEEEAAEPPPPPHLFGTANQMIFADLDPIHEVEPVTVINGPEYHRVVPGSWYDRRQAWNEKHPEFFEPVEELVVA